MKVSVFVKVELEVDDILAFRLGGDVAVERLLYDAIDGDIVRSHSIHLIDTWECEECGYKRANFGPCYCVDEYKEWQEMDKRG